MPSHFSAQATVDLLWQGGELARCYLRGVTQPITVRYGNQERLIELPAGEQLMLGPDLNTIK